MADTFQCTVVTPEASVLETEAKHVNVPAHDGQKGILANHAALLMKLGDGVLTVDLADGSKQQFTLSGGFGQMRDNKLTLITEKAEALEAATA